LQEISEKKYGRKLSEIDYWEKPMIWDIFAWLMMIIFGISVFYTITFIGSADANLQQKGWINVILAVMFGFGLTLKSFCDKLQLTETIKKGDTTIIILLDETVTRSRFETPSARGIGTTLFGFGICIGTQLGISVFLRGVPLSIYDLTIDKITFAMVSAVSEEMFFLAFQDVTGSIIKWGSLPLVIGMFGLYHGVTYSGMILSIVYVIIGRTIYALMYSWLKRPSMTMMAHLLGNIITLIQI
jgi:hypothetical protein